MRSRLAITMNLGWRILAATVLAVIVTAAAVAQSAPAVSPAEARTAIQAGYAEYAKARVAQDMNAIERILAPDFYFQTPAKKLTRREFIDTVPVQIAGRITFLQRFTHTDLHSALRAG